MRERLIITNSYMKKDDLSVILFFVTEKMVMAHEFKKKNCLQKASFLPHLPKKMYFCNIYCNMHDSF